MIDHGRDCIAVLQQTAAAQKAMDAVGTVVVRNYVERCVTSALSGAATRSSTTS